MNSAIFFKTLLKKKKKKILSSLDQGTMDDYRFEIADIAPMVFDNALIDSSGKGWTTMSEVEWRKLLTGGSNGSSFNRNDIVMFDSLDRMKSNVPTLTIVSTLQLVIASFGIVANVINVTMFVRQGITKESSAASLFILSLTDMLFCVVLGVNEFATIVLENSTTPRNKNITLQFKLKSTTSIIMGIFRASSLTTMSYISFERMLAVCAPFLAQFYFTPKRSCTVGNSILVIITALSGPLFSRHFQNSKNFDNESFSMAMNILENIPDKGGELNELFAISGTVLRFMLILSIVIFNTIIIFKVKSSVRFRSGSSSNATNNETRNIRNNNASTSTQISNDKTNYNGHVNAANTKELKLIKMLLALCIMTVACSIPNTVITFLGLRKIFIPSRNLPFDVISVIRIVVIFVDYIPLCANLLIYYTLSSRYKENLKLLIVCSKRTINF